MAEQPIALDAGKPRMLCFQTRLRRDLKLLELEEGLLRELLDTGLHIKGGDHEEAVLCSGDRTFAIKNVETTNLVLLVEHDKPEAREPLGSQDGNAPAPTPPGALTGLATQLSKGADAACRPRVRALAAASSHLELVASGPRLHRLDAALWAAPYGADDEGDAMDEDGAPGRPGGCTWERLLRTVQASPGELRAALAERSALRLPGGRWTAVDPGYLGELLELVLLTAEEKGWALAALPAAELADALAPHGFNPRVTLHCLEVFGRRVDSGAAALAEGDSAAATGTGASAQRTASAAACSPSGELLAPELLTESRYALASPSVCRHFGLKLLAARTQWELGQFQEAWEGSVPEGMEPSLEMLAGEALALPGGAVKRFPLRDLPSDPAARFAALFAERPRWELPELQPYLVGLAGPGQTAEALLLKYARASQPRPTDPVTYSAR